MNVTIRPARPGDLERINEIYDTVIVDSHVSFDLEPWDLERRRRWWEDRAGLPRVVTLVAERNGVVIGTAYSSRYRPKEAYDTSVETTVVLDPAETGGGVGTLLLGALLDRLAAAGVHRAYAIVALPNDASVAVHRKLGYEPVGVLDEAGFKLGRFWSTLLLEKRFEG